MAFLVSAGDPDYRRSRHARFRSPTRGVRVEADADGWWDDLSALAMVIPAEGVFSHTTAAFVAGMPLPQWEPRPFHVTVPGSRGSRAAVVWHKRDLQHAVEVYRGFPLTSPLRTWHDLGPLLRTRDLVVVADHLLRRELVSVEEIVVVPPCRAAARLRLAAGLADGRSRSPRESLVRVEMLARGLPRPELNLDIIEDRGWIGCGDFVWPHWRVIADYDGDHHRDPRQHAQDNDTRNQYAEYGWRHVALSKRMLKNMDAAIERIAVALRARGWRD